MSRSVTASLNHPLPTKPMSHASFLHTNCGPAWSHDHEEKEKNRNYLQQDKHVNVQWQKQAPRLGYCWLLYAVDPLLSTVPREVRKYYSTSSPATSVVGGWPKAWPSDVFIQARKYFQETILTCSFGSDHPVVQLQNNRYFQERITTY